MVSFSIFLTTLIVGRGGNTFGDYQNSAQINLLRYVSLCFLYLSIEHANSRNNDFHKIAPYASALGRVSRFSLLSYSTLLIFGLARSSAEFNYLKFIAEALYILLGALLSARWFFLYQEVAVRHTAMVFCLISMFLASLSVLPFVNSVVSLNQRLSPLGAGPNTAARIFSFGIIAGVYLLSVAVKRSQKALYSLSIMGGIVGLALAQSRGVLVSLMIAVLFIYLFSLKKKGRVISSWKGFRLGLLGFSFLSLSLWLLFQFQLVAILLNQRYINLTQERYDSTRVFLFKSTLEQIRESPFVGIGLGKFVDPTNQDSYPHNFILETWLSIGLLGVIFSLMFLFSILRNAFACASQRNFPAVAFLTACSILAFTSIQFSGTFFDSRFCFILFASLEGYSNSLIHQINAGSIHKEIRK